MTSLFVNYRDFNPARLQELTIASKQSKPKINPEKPNDPPESVTYHIAQILYQYPVTRPDGSDGVTVGPLAIEFPTVKSDGGINSKVNKLGFDSSSIFTTFDMNDSNVAHLASLGPEQTGTEIGPLAQLYAFLVDQIWSKRAQVPFVARLPNKMALLGMFTNFLFYKVDDNGRVLAGTNPSKYLQLLSRGKPGTAGRRETIFKAPIESQLADGTVIYPTIDWELLRNVTMTYDPIITFTNIMFTGGKINYQHEMTSAVVRSVIPVNSESAQKETLSKASKDASAVSTLERQLEVLRARLETEKALGRSEEKKDDGALVVRGAAPPISAGALVKAQPIVHAALPVASTGSDRVSPERSVIAGSLPASLPVTTPDHQALPTQQLASAGGLPTTMAIPGALPAGMPMGLPTSGVSMSLPAGGTSNLHALLRQGPVVQSATQQTN